MDRVKDRKENQETYRRLKETINQTYSKGRFIAISKGQIVGDARDFDELQAQLKAAGQDPFRVLIVQAGVEYPDKVVIFSQAFGHVAHST